MLRERGIVLLKETHPRISCKAFLRVNMLRFFGVTYLQSDSRRLPSEMLMSPIKTLGFPR